MSGQFRTTEEAAREIARENAANEENQMVEVWQFPDDNEVRLVEIDETAMPYMPDERYIAAYAFPGDPNSRNPFGVAIAAIRPEDKYRLELPRGWGDWSRAKKIWSRSETAGRIRE